MIILRAAESKTGKFLLHLTSEFVYSIASSSILYLISYVESIQVL